ncbi:MAG: hypothetical protein ACTSVU_08975 [Promethearchaeota archaeon]
MKEIALMGMEGCGKSSILEELQTNFTSLFSNVPLKSYDILGTSMQIINYKDYLCNNGNFSQKLNDIVNSIDYLIYTFDVQDKIRNIESLVLLQKVLKIKNKFSKPFNLAILFHKFDDDKDLDSIKEFSSILHSVVKITALNPIPIYHFKTSIYRPYSLITAFSKPIFDHEGIFSPMNHILKQFAQKMKLKSLNLFTKNSICLGSYFSEDENEDNKRNIILEFLKKREDQFEINPELIIDLVDQTVYLMKFYINQKPHDLPIYLTWGIGKSEPKIRDLTNISEKIYELEENMKVLLFNIQLQSSMLI